MEDGKDGRVDLKCGRFSGGLEVSIPFKREGVSKDYFKGKLRTENRRFHSLPTGKRIQRIITHLNLAPTMSFHSLPTGKRI